MSLKRYATSRDQNEAEIVKALRDVGATVHLLDQPVDLLVGFRGRNWLLEVKRNQKGSLTPPQINFIQTWRGEVAVVRTPEQALAAITR